MDILAPIVRWVIAPAWAIRDRNPYLRHYRRLLRTQFDPPAVIQRRQWGRIEQLLRHAYETTRFWRRRLEAASLKPGDIRSWDDFRRIPLLTKNDLRAHQDELLSSKYDRASLPCSRTSGSTGVPVAVFKDNACCHFGQGCTLRSDEWSGWRLGERVAVIWGNAAQELRGPGWRGYLRNALLDRRTFADSLCLNEETLKEFVTTLRRKPPSLLFGHAHSLYLVANYLECRGPTDIRPTGIISSAMVLHDWERETIERVFHCPVTNRYGCEEVGLIACECEKHDGLHVNADGLFVEIIRPDGAPCPPGEPGMVVVTDLRNRAMPLIRYQIGDTAAWAGRACPCGRGLPLLERVEGRVADYVLTPRGELVSGISLTDHFNTLVPGVVQMQIVQEEIDRFLFRIVRGPDYGEASARKIGELVAVRFGPEVRYECEFVDRIPQEPSGKFRFCISRVRKPFVS